MAETRVRHRTLVLLAASAVSVGLSGCEAAATPTPPAVTPRIVVGSAPPTAAPTGVPPAPTPVSQLPVPTSPPDPGTPTLEPQRTPWPGPTPP